MLSDEEKREMLEDGMSKKRCEDFRKVKEFDMKYNTNSLDDLIQFCDQIQQIFGPFEISRKKNTSSRNLL